MGWECVIAAPGGLLGARESAPTRLELEEVDGGDSFAVGVDGDGRVVGWGRAFYGELGDGDGDHASRLRELALPVDCARVACGQNHVLAVSRDGASVFAWGSNRWRQVGNMTDAVVATPTRVLLDSLAEPILSIAAGGMHSLAVDTAGHVWSWGQNKFGQLGRESVDSDRCGSPDRVALPTDVQTLQAAAGWAHSALVSTDGRVFTFGWGMYHQLGHGAAQNEREPVMVDALVGLDVSSRVVQVACGTWHTGARTATGDLYTWGWGPDGQLGHDKATVSQVYPRAVDLPPLALSAPPNAEDDGYDVLDVACGSRFTVGLLASGDVVWCGLSASSSVSEAAWRVARRSGADRALTIAAGATHAFALVVEPVYNH